MLTRKKPSNGSTRSGRANRSEDYATPGHRPSPSRSSWGGKTAPVATPSGSLLGLLCICGGAQAVGKTGVLGPVHLSLLRSRKRLLAQGVDGFRSALATPYSSAWTRPRLKSSRACRDGSLRRSSVRLSDAVMTSVESCPPRSAEFPVALLQSQNWTSERRLSRANYVAGCVSKI